MRVADLRLEQPSENPVYIDSPGLKVPVLSFQGDVMFRGIVILFSLIAFLVLEYQVAAQQGPPPPHSPQALADQALRLLLRCSLKRPGALWDAHAIAPNEVVVTNPNLELKLYGPSATASDPDKRIWIFGPSRPPQHLDRDV